MKKQILVLSLAIIGMLTLWSCSDDKKSLVLPVFELGLSSDNIHVGDKVNVSLTNKNNPTNLRYNSYAWSCDPDVDGLQATSNTNNYFVPLGKGKHTISVKIDITNYVDGNSADSGKEINSGETKNTYNSVSTLKTFMTVSRSFIVK